MDIAGLHDEEEAEETELVFDDDEDELAAFLASVSAPEPDPEPTPEPVVIETAEPKTKKRAAKGKPLPDPEPEPIVESSPAPPVIASPDPVSLVAATAAPATGAPATVTPAAPAAPAGRLVTVAVMAAAFASVISGVGVVVTAHNLAALSQAKAEADGRQAMLAKLPALIASVEHLRDAQRVELARAAAINPAAAVTLPQLRQELDNTRMALGKSQPSGIGALGSIVRAGQTDLAQRIIQLDEYVRTRGTQRPSHQLAGR